MDDAADQDEGAEMEMELEVSPSREDVEMELEVSRPVTAPPQPGAFAASSTCCSDDECGHVVAGGSGGGGAAAAAAAAAASPTLPTAAGTRGDGETEPRSMDEMLSALKASMAHVPGANDLFDKVLQDEERLLRAVAAAGHGDPDNELEGLDLPAVLAELDAEVFLTQHMVQQLASEAPREGMPNFADVPRCCGMDCLRTLWLGDYHDELPRAAVTRVWEIYARCHAASDDDSAPAAAAEAAEQQMPRKRMRPLVGQKQLGGYLPGGPRAKKRQPGRKFAKFAATRKRQAEEALDNFRNESLKFLATLKLHAHEKEGEIQFKRMCRGGICRILAVDKNWLYRKRAGPRRGGKRKAPEGAAAAAADAADAAQPDEPDAQGQSLVEELGLSVSAVPGAREGLPEDGEGLRRVPCCLGNCLWNTKAAELDAVLADVRAARTSKSRWEVCKRALVLRPHMCDSGLEKWLGRGIRYIRRVAQQDRWKQVAPTNKNTGRAPWNRLDSLQVVAIQHVIDIFTYTDPEDPESSGEQGPLRVFTSTQVNTVRRTPSPPHIVLWTSRSLI